MISRALGLSLEPQGDQYSGPNRIHNMTLYTYCHIKYGVKESQVRLGSTGLCQNAPPPCPFCNA